MILKFEGVVTTGDAYRVAEDEDEGSVLVGGRDLVGEVADAEFTGPVTVAVADERFYGDLIIEEGWGYSDWTPMDPDSLVVGEHDIIEVLLRHDGNKVTVWVADEPVNLLESSGRSDTEGQATDGRMRERGKIWTWREYWVVCYLCEREVMASAEQNTMHASEAEFRRWGWKKAAGKWWVCPDCIHSESGRTDGRKP